MSMNNIIALFEFSFKNDENIKLGFFRRLIGIVRVFADDIISTSWPTLVKNCDNPSTSCAIPPMPPDVGEINSIFIGKKSD